MKNIFLYLGVFIAVIGSCSSFAKEIPTYAGAIFTAFGVTFAGISIIIDKLDKIQNPKPEQPKEN